MTTGIIGVSSAEWKGRRGAECAEKVREGLRPGRDRAGDTLVVWGSGPILIMIGEPVAGAKKIADVVLRLDGTKQ